jgi:hypothetical protein
MLATNILLVIVTLTAIGWALSIGIRYRRRLILNQKIGKELDLLIESTIQLVKNKKQPYLKKQKGAKSVDMKTGNTTDLESPEMLSSILAVIVHKYGNLRLGIRDFTNVANEDYISVYVDTTTNELILSLDHHMAGSDPLGLVNLSKPGDNTFH